jgi:hypothetical protein
VGCGVGGGGGGADTGVGVGVGVGGCGGGGGGNATTVNPLLADAESVGGGTVPPADPAVDVRSSAAIDRALR